jgi:hypothetical protein
MHCSAWSQDVYLEITTTGGASTFSRVSDLSSFYFSKKIVGATIRGGGRVRARMLRKGRSEAKQKREEKRRKWPDHKFI